MYLNKHGSTKGKAQNCIKALNWELTWEQYLLFAENGGDYCRGKHNIPGAYSNGKCNYNKHTCISVKY